MQLWKALETTLKSMKTRIDRVIVIAQDGIRIKAIPYELGILQPLPPTAQIHVLSVFGPDVIMKGNDQTKETKSGRGAGVGTASLRNPVNEAAPIGPSDP